MSALKPDVRKRIMLLSVYGVMIFTIISAYLMIDNAPTSVFAFSMVGLTLFAVILILAYAWPHMTVDAGLRCPRCGAEIREDFVVCPACTIELKPR